MHHRFVVTVARGLESALAAELSSFGLDGVEPGHGIVTFGGPLELGYRVCLRSRLASRALVQIAEIPASTPDALYEGARALPWHEHLDAQTTLAVRFSGRSPKIRHPHFGALRVKDAICDALRERTGARPSVDRDEPDLTVAVNLRAGIARLAVDLSGIPLHRRGLDRDGGPAPLRETLAAGLLCIAGWPALAHAGVPLLDPFCGSGTLLVEAAEIALARAPGLRRARWGFHGWHGHDEAAWRREVRAARESERSGAGVRIVGADRDPAQVARARALVERAGLSEIVRVIQQDLTDAAPIPDTPEAPPRGLIVTNPPYGVRLGDQAEVAQIWRQLGDVLRQRFLGWHAFVLAGDPALAKALGLRAKSRHIVFNGPLEGRLLEVPISTEPARPRR